jgi:uncharacterized membrane protein YcaP (DUF421 family)
MLLLVIRTAVLYVVTMLSMRAMGKRQIGQLQPFELVVILIISEMATIGVQNNGMPLMNSLLPIVTITVLQIVIALINLKSEKIRLFVCGRPSFVIRNGEILEEEMRRLRLNTNDLLEQLRAKGYFDVAEVEFALMETNGQLSVLPRADKRALQPADLDLCVGHEIPAITLIIDGVIHQAHLQAAGYDETWLEKKLAAYNIRSAADVFFMSVDYPGHVFCQLKSRGEEGSPAPVREGAKTAPPGSGEGCSRITDKGCGCD